MSEEGKDSAPTGVPQPVFGITRQQLAGIVAGNRAALGLPPQRDHQAEQDHAEFAGWFEAQGYTVAEFESDGMAEAFTAGMQAARDLADVAEPKPARELAAAMGETRELRTLVAEILDKFGKSGSGMTARVGQVQIAKWSVRAGLDGRREREIVAESENA